MRLVLLAITLAGCGQAAEPSLCRVCEPVDVDFGTVRLGTKAERTLLYENRSDRPLRLRMLRAGEDLSAPWGTDFTCGRVCEEAQIPAGSTIELTFSFEPVAGGPVNTDVHVGTSDGTDLLIRLHGEGARPLVNCQAPRSVTFDSHMSGYVDYRIPCTGSELFPLTITSEIEFQSMFRFFEVTSRERVVDRGAEFAVALTLQLPGGLVLPKVPPYEADVSEDLVLRDELDMEVARVPLEFRVVASLLDVDFGVPEGECIEFGSVAADQVEQRPIVVHNPGPHWAGQIWGSSDPGGVFGIETDGFAPGETREIHVFYRPRSAGEDSGWLSVTNSGEGRCLHGSAF